MTVARRGTPNATVITVDGAFDITAATRLKALVLDIPSTDALTLDFREVRQFHDCAIEALAAALSGHPAVKFVGLSEHHYRLLRYVGTGGASHDLV